MGEVIQRSRVGDGLIEVLRLPDGQLSYRSSAAGYALYSDSRDRAITVLGWLQGRI